MKLKTNPNGAVSFVLISGPDKVKSTMLESEALELIAKGKVDKKGSSIVVDDKFIFEVAGGEAEKAAEKAVDKPLKEAAKEDKKPIGRKPRRKAKK